MSNKMKKYFFLIYLLLVVTLLHCFEPGQDDFLNSYQYGLYRSWLQKSNCRVDAPAAFTPEKITKLFSLPGQEIKIEYDWINYKITNQREVLTSYQFSLPQNITHYLGSFLYRFNCADSTFVLDFLENTRTELSFTGKKETAGFSLLWQEKGSERINLSDIQNIELDKIENSITIYLSDSTIILFLEELKIDLSILLEPESRYKIDLPPEEYIKEEPPGITVEIPETMSLREYISRNYQRQQTREMLHNKIEKVGDFLQTEFPDHQVKYTNEGYLIEAGQFQDFHDRIAINYTKQDDGINILPDNSFELVDKEFRISNESIDLSKLADQEINSLAPYLPQLIYEHRSIGSRLLDFLLIHDNVPTTLLLKTEEREKFEIASYADLLLMLNKYWTDRKIFFKINDFKKVNNYIEFKGFLLAVEQDLQTADSAEIWFHLDKEFRIDLIMMMLYPDVKL